MLRAVLTLCAVGTLLGWGYALSGAKTSYSSYSEEQLQMLSAEADRVGRSQKSGAEDAWWTAELVQSERNRRTFVLWGLPTAALLAGAALLASRRRKPLLNGDPEEAARLAGFVRNNVTVGAEAKARAAKVLGVHPEAPLVVIEAAFQAQLAACDQTRYPAGSAHAQIAEGQRNELIRARELLLRRPTG